jgi:FMN phosphatase YigB (HAD superfamily)
MVRPFDVITFDCYGTLIDWEAGISEAFRKVSASDDVSLDPAAVMRNLFDTTPAAERPYQTYREILTAAAVRVSEHLGWMIGRDRAAFLPESLPDWPPFADTNHALTRPRPLAWGSSTSMFKMPLCRTGRDTLESNFRPTM